MLETIRQFAEEQLFAAGRRRESGPRTPATSPGAKRTSWSCGTALGNGRPTTGSPPSWPNLRTAFRWAADSGDLDVAATIATSAPILGNVVEKCEPIAWAEELIEPARAVDHPLLAGLYEIASSAGRSDGSRRRSAIARPGRSCSAASRNTGCRAAARAGFAYLHGHRPAQTGGRVVPRPARTRSRHPHTHPGSPGPRTDVSWFRR